MTQEIQSEQGQDVPVEQGSQDGQEVPVEQGQDVPVEQGSQDGQEVPVEQGSQDGQEVPVEQGSQDGQEVPVEQGQDVPVEQGSQDGQEVPVEQGQDVPVEQGSQDGQEVPVEQGSQDGQEVPVEQGQDVPVEQGSQDGQEVPVEQGQDVPVEQGSQDGQEVPVEQGQDVPVEQGSQDGQEVPVEQGQDVPVEQGSQDGQPSKKSSSIMKKISLEKVVLNMGVGKSGDAIVVAKTALDQISGRKSCERSAKESQRDWGVRKGEPIGASVTIRGEEAEALLKRLFEAKGNVVNGRSFDNFGNHSFGISEHIDIPGIKYEPRIGILGLGISIALTRPGYSIRKRSKHKARIGKPHIITNQEAKDYLIKEFGVTVA